MATKESNEIKTLDTLRRRLLTISTNLLHFRSDLESQIILPPWNVILATCQDLASNLADLQIFLQNNKAFENLDLHIAGYDVPRFLNTAHVYPTNDFPRTQENALGMLLTKKLAPAVEEWIDEAVKAAQEANEKATKAEDSALSADQLQDLWLEMVMETQDKAAHMDDRPQEEGSDEDGSDEDGDDDDDEEMEDVGSERKGKEAVSAPLAPMMKLEDVLRFMSTGTVR